MSTITRAKPSTVDREFHVLNQRFPLVRIRSDPHLQEAHAIIDELSIIDEQKLTPGQDEYLYTLSMLVHDYEQHHHRIDTSDIDGVEALKYLLEQNNMSASDLGRLLGNRQLGSAILRRERQLSKAHIMILCERFKVSADLFLR